MPSHLAPTSAPAPDRLVRTHHRRRRHTALVWSLAFAALAAALSFATHLSWLPASTAFVISHSSFVIASALALTLWLIRARRLDAPSVARDLDTEWQLKARLEASAELASNPSAFAAAQRADTASRIAGRRPPRAFLWHAGQLTLVLALLFLLVESSVFGIRLLDSPPPPPAAPEDISASIEWRTPESEIKATSIEEIALTASASTRTGFRTVSLEISVNGEPRLSLPLDSTQLAALAKPGAHSVNAPLYLDETQAAEFDIVAYHLRADRSTRSPAPAITSPLQFIQIRPARDDVERRKAMSGSGKDKLGELAALIGGLKAAQLALLKQNFLLAHAPIAKTEKAWTDSNTTVAADQKLLSEKAAEARAFAIAEEIDALVVDHLTQVIPIMEEAAKLITETQNEPAARPQGRALGLITALEKLIRKILLESEGAAAAGGPPPPKNPDPFKDDQRYRLPPRKDTAAGKLEQLAKDQTEQAEKTDPSSASSSGAPKPQPSPADQAELARRAEELAKNQQLSDAAQKAAAQAARDAAAAAKQLDQGDASAARAPSQAAAQTLRDAAAAQEKAGRDAARAALEAARRALNEAAREPDAATRAEKLDAVARDLHDAAREQQESGSAEAARQLEAAARAAAKAAEAARKGTDSAPPPPSEQPGAGPGTQPGNVSPSDQPGTQPASRPGDQPGQRPGGDKPGTQPGNAPSSQLTPDPEGEKNMTVTLPGAGLQPGEGLGKEPGKQPGQGEGQGEGPGPTPGTEPGTKPGSGEGTGPGSTPSSTGRQQTRVPSPTERAAQAAATAQVALSDRAEAAGRAARQLQRGSGEGSGPGASPGPVSASGPGTGTGTASAEGPGSGSGVGVARSTTDTRPSELVLGAQLAHAVLNTPESAGLAATIVNTFTPSDKYAPVVVTPDVRAAVDRLRVMLAAALSDDRRDETIRRFNPEDLDPAYREAIESYFERLSREATK